MRFFTICLFSLFACSVGLAQSSTNFWTDIAENQINLSAERAIIPEQYRTVSLDFNNFKIKLAAAPLEFSAAANQPLKVVLPLPDGTMEKFEVLESPVMMPELVAKFPQIKSYKGKSAKSIVRFDISPRGFHASIFTPKGEVYIDPYLSVNSSYYTTYYTKDFKQQSPIALSCGASMNEATEVETTTPSQHQSNSVELRNNEPILLRTYRLAMACTGEYAAYHGGTTEGALAAINTAVNRLNSVFERDLAIRMLLVDNNEEIIFLDGANDFYTNGDLEEMNTENPLVLNTRIGADNYDVGHVFGTNNALNGLALLQSVCASPANKGRGGSTSATPEGDPFVISVVAHEIGHQMGATHSFNSCHNVNQETGYEPGGGTTIMSYAGICGDPANNLANDSDDYYNVGALVQIFAHMRDGVGDTCPTKIETGNNEPKVTIDLENGFFIPTSTPFELTANAVDENNDNLTYCWEQYDLGPENSVPGSPMGDSPLFRSFPPTESSTRIFPQLNKIINNTSNTAEVLPDYGRNLTFRCTVRDNNEVAGATVWEEVAFKVSEEAGPFLVNHPNVDTVEWNVGDYREVTWDVAGTTNPNKVNCQHVNIKLSTDGGFSYPITLSENTPNDGSEFITVPNNESGSARIKVEAADNIFFDISNRNFKILPAAAPGFALTVTPAFQELCLPALAEFTIETASLLAYDSLITFEVTGGLPDGAVVTFSENEVAPGTAVNLMVDLTDVNLTGTINLTLQSTAPSLDTILRVIELDVVSSDFSALTQLSPINGSTGLSGLPPYSWEPSPNATSYEIEIATDPNFGDAVVETATGLTEAIYNPTIALEENTIYYWRVRGINRCGAGDFITPFAFQTLTAACSTTNSPNVPLFLPSTSTTVQSTITFTESGIINSLKVPVVRGTYDGINGIVMTLESPAGTTAILYNRECSVTNSFNVGFNDAAAAAIGTECPPTSGLEYIPVEPLSIFNNENSQGTWTLKITIQQAGSGGSLDEWALEFCANLTPSAPFIVNNEVFPIPPGARSQIGQDFLLAQDSDNSSDQLTYTLVTIPANGILYKEDEALTVGSTFRQIDINSWKMSYEHDGGASEMDNFVFTVSDGTGGWFGTPTFEISIFDDAPVGTQVISESSDIEIYPNPTSSILNVSFEKEFKDDIQLDIYNVQGQQLSVQTFETTQNVTVDATQMAAGIYFLTIRTTEGVYSKRFVKK